ncbi:MULTISPECIES: carbohydrate ABC transporter permease [Streptosporangium]|uniref:Multiple sugar transport system permease protein n=1 Tax=Streptosporangium brasiliense TaxID=47480 RepID=A0ABT9QZ22_9ACTN|nr:sugar ABC transporter permease [Streptosporangium brasiliense]MDP9862224.1 multiple sugar transport system permease protein [Streptosporangium brasiliense]
MSSLTTLDRPAAGPAGGGRTGQGSLKREARRRRGAITLFLAPFFVLFAAVLVAPLGYAVWLSLFSEKSSGLGFGGSQTVFAGLDNYLDTLADPAFRDGFAVIAGYCALYIPLMIGGALLLALLLDSGLARVRRFFQLVLFLPHVVPGIIAALIWMYLYLPGVSPVVGALESGGIRWDFLSSDKVLGSVVNIALWEWIGYNMIIYFAALQAIPREVIEASTVDGAGPVRTALRVKLPMIRGAVVMTMLFTIIGSLQLFTEPMILADASAGVVSTWTPNMFAYTEAFSKNDYGQAAAASLLLAALAAGLSYAVTRFGARRGA